MSEAFVGQIKMFAGNFAPRGYALCEGQLLAVSQNDALFSLLGTIYGGDGRTTFGLPDLRGRVPLHKGSGPGLTPRTIGSKGGEENVLLTVNQLPSHGHDLIAQAKQAETTAPAGQMLADGAINIYNATAPDVTLAGDAIASTGGSQGHGNMMPYLGINFIIALVGTYPSRT